MKIDFYEEFPTRENLGKLKLIKFNSRVFIATKSLKKFRGIEKQIKKINKNIECAYGPIAKNSYYISSFSNTRDLIELFEELKNCGNHLLIDLELPLNRKMVTKNILYYFKNRKIIKDFLESNKEKITTAQYSSSIRSLFMKILGLNYNLDLEKSFMWYSSTNSKFMNNNIKNSLIKLKNKNKYSISLGTIAIGVLGNEPILSPSKLKDDLEFAKNAGFDKVIIFRLGGLNKEYVQVINQFSDKP